MKDTLIDIGGLLLAIPIAIFGAFVALWPVWVSLAALKILGVF